MKILVTGSSGTIGTRLCEKLLEHGHDVIGIDWKPNKWQPAIEKLTVHLDLRDENQLKAPTFAKATAGRQSSKLKADLVIHLAANARVYDLVERPDLARDNVLTTFNALEFARASGIKRFIFASSRECYGNGTAEKYTEDMVRVGHCESPYTASKLAGEALVEAYRRCYALNTIIVRFSNVYGMYDDSERVVPLFIREARKGAPLTIFGKEKCLDFTYIDDAVQGVLLMVEKFEQAKGNTFNIASGKASTIIALAELLKALLKSASILSLKPSRTGEVTRFAADLTKARTMLGYEPKVVFEEGVKKAVEWYGKR